MLEAPAGFVADAVLPPVIEAPKPNTSTKELPSLKPDDTVRDLMGLPKAEVKLAERPAATAAETVEMKKLLKTIKAPPPEQPTIPLPEEELNVPQPTSNSGDKKPNILSKVFGGIWTAIAAAGVFVLTKIKTLLNFGDDPHAQRAG